MEQNYDFKEIFTNLGYVSYSAFAFDYFEDKFIKLYIKSILGAKNNIKDNN